MKTLIKLRLLFSFLPDAIESWHTEVWIRDLNEPYSADPYWENLTVLDVWNPDNQVKE
jgi:hypothetical protein